MEKKSIIEAITDFKAEFSKFERLWLNKPFFIKVLAFLGLELKQKYKL